MQRNDGPGVSNSRGRGRGCQMAIIVCTERNHVQLVNLLHSRHIEDDGSVWHDGLDELLWKVVAIAKLVCVHETSELLRTALQSRSSKYDDKT